MSPYVRKTAAHGIPKLYVYVCMSIEQCRQPNMRWWYALDLVPFYVASRFNYIIVVYCGCLIDLT